MTTTITPWPDGLRYRGLAGGTRSAGGTASRRVQIYPGTEREREVRFPWEVPNSKDFYPIVAMFWGRRGQGKTLSMTAFGAMMLQRYIRSGIKSSPSNPNGHKIVANYHVTFADFYNPMLVDMLVDFPWWAHDMCCLVDEILAFFPNRRSLARGNLNFATFLQQIRKRGIELLFCTQFPQNMDKQMVEQIDLFIRPELFNNGNSVRLHIWDWWGQFTGNMNIKRWPPMPERDPPDWIVPLHGIKAVYGAYPTGEVVAPMWIGNRDEIIGSQWNDEELASSMTNPPGAKGGPVEVAPNFNEFVSSKPETLLDLIIAQGDEFFVDSIIDAAKRFDKKLRKTSDLHQFLNANGYILRRDGSRFLAMKEDVE